MKQPLIVLTGPTASGKTALSIELAKAIGGEISSADSMQVYRQMDIGTAKIRPEEMEGIPHYLVDVLEPDDPFNVVVFQQMAKAAMKKIREMILTLKRMKMTVTEVIWKQWQQVTAGRKGFMRC